jgi:rhodanese-related sulfurtransferase
MNKIIIALLAVVILAVLISGCSSAEPSATTTSPAITTTPPEITTTSPAATQSSEPLILYQDAPATYEELPKVTPEELKAKIDNKENIVIVDVNPKSMYDKGHVPGAIHLPWSFKGFTEDPNLPKNVPVIFYCVCENEEDSGLMGLSAVSKYGYRNIMLLKGGTPAWEDAGFPMEKSN